MNSTKKFLLIFKFYNKVICLKKNSQILIKQFIIEANPKTLQ